MHRQTDGQRLIKTDRHKMLADMQMDIQATMQRDGQKARQIHRKSGCERQTNAG